jgi:hypothetical protein
MEYLGRAFNSANADVRAAAVKVAVISVELGGPSVRRRLPRDINPKIKEQLDASLGTELSAGRETGCGVGVMVVAHELDVLLEGNTAAASGTD